jgi:hypothetical protein
VTGVQTYALPICGAGIARVDGSEGSVKVSSGDYYLIIGLKDGRPHGLGGAEGGYRIIGKQEIGDPAFSGSHRSEEERSVGVAF